MPSPQECENLTATVYGSLAANPRATHAQIPQFPSQALVQKTRTRFTATLADDSQTRGRSQMSTSVEMGYIPTMAFYTETDNKTTNQRMQQHGSTS